MVYMCMVYMYVYIYGVYHHYIMVYMCMVYMCVYVCICVTIDFDDECSLLWFGGVLKGTWLLHVCVSVCVCV